jgi:protein TorT
MKNKYLLFVLTVFLVLPSSVIGETERITVHSYYGTYDVKQKKSGFPSGGLEGPVTEEWLSPVPENTYRIGVLFPHLKDSYWGAANYGIVSHAKKLGVEIILYSAGAYINFGNQKQQLFDLAEKKEVNGIILSAVDYRKMDSIVEKVSDTGVPVIGLINDIHSPAIKAKAMVSYFDAGYKAGEFVVKDSLKKNIRVAFFPGPKKSGWAEDMYEGFMSAVSELKKGDRSVTVLDPQYGDTRPEVQRMRLSFLLNKQENRDTDYIVGNAVAAVEAVTYMKNNKNISPNTKIVSTYITGALYDYIKKGDIKAAPYDQTMIICQIALDMMVRLLNGEKAGKDFPFRAGPDYILITTENIAQYSYEKLFGARNFKPVFNVTP